jgi:hypothetical protein
MLQAMNAKMVGVVLSQAIKDDTDWVGTSASTPVVVDTLGFHFAVFNWWLGASDIAQASLIVVSDDDSALGSATTRYTFGGTGLMALPTATNDGGFWKLGIDLRGKERYWGITAKAGNGSTGAYAVGWFELYRADQEPATATARGLVAQDYI